MTIRHALLAFGAIAIWATMAEAQTRNPPIRAQCADDIKKLCPNAKPDDGSIPRCLQQNEDKLSQGCKDARAAMRRQIERKSAPSPN